MTGDIHHLTHGEKVAYGTLTQLFLENRSREEIDRYIDFYQAIGMPTTLKEMHLDTASQDDFLKLAAKQPWQAKPSIRCHLLSAQKMWLQLWLLLMPMSLVDKDVLL